MEGLSAQVLASAAARAGGDATPEKGPWRLGLDMPVLQAVLLHGRDPAVREAMYRAGPGTKQQNTQTKTKTNAIQIQN